MGGVKHGTISGYKNLKCRCDDCRDAQRRYMIEYYRRNPHRRTKYTDTYVCEGCQDTVTKVINSRGYKTRFCPTCQRKQALGQFYREPTGAIPAPRRSVPRVTVFRRDNYECWICGTPTSSGAAAHHPLAPVADHVVPFVRGGADDVSNLRTAHTVCNARKHDTMPDVYLARIEKAFS